MEKTRINLDILLPELPNERDECVRRIVKALEYRRGIDKVHIVPEEGNKKAQLCFHYDPSIISINKVEQLANEAGAEITERYGHLLIETSGVRQPSHARIIEAGIRKQKGIQNVSVSGTGYIQIEFNKETAPEETIIQQIRRAGLRIDKVEDFHRHEHKEEALPKDEDKDKHTHDDHDHAAHDHEHSHGGIFGVRHVSLHDWHCHHHRRRRREQRQCLIGRNWLVECAAVDEIADTRVGTSALYG